MSDITSALSHEDYEALITDVQKFRGVRDGIVGLANNLRATISAIKESGAEIGKFPFILEDGETYLAILREEGDAVALPYGYDLDTDDMVLPKDVVIFSTLASTDSGLIRFIPVSPDFSDPDETDFIIEHQLESEFTKFDFDGLDFCDDRYFRSDSGLLYSGRAVLRWSNGELRKEAQMVDGKFQGKVTWWYENGQKELEDHYIASMRHGEHRAWHENGKLWAQGESVDGQRQGTWRWWHDNGQISEETNYRDGQSHGKSTRLVRGWRNIHDYGV